MAKRLVMAAAAKLAAHHLLPPLNKRVEEWWAERFKVETPWLTSNCPYLWMVFVGGGWFGVVQWAAGAAGTPAAPAGLVLASSAATARRACSRSSAFQIPARAFFAPGWVDLLRAGRSGGAFAEDVPGQLELLKVDDCFVGVGSGHVAEALLAEVDPVGDDDLHVRYARPWSGQWGIASISCRAPWRSRDSATAVPRVVGSVSRSCASSTCPPPRTTTSPR